MPVGEYAASLGLAVAPRMRFLAKAGKKAEAGEGEGREREEEGESDDGSEIEEDAAHSKAIAAAAAESDDNDDDDDDDDLMVVKRRDVFRDDGDGKDGETAPPATPGQLALDSSRLVKKKKKKLRLTGIKCAACGERARAAAAGAASPFGGEVTVDWLKAEATLEIPSSSCVGESCTREASSDGDSDSVLLSGVIEALGEAGFGASAAEEEEES